MTIAVLDIDGVVADVRHRLSYLDGRPKNWDAFFAAAADDPVLPEGAALTAQLALEHDIVWLTGRPQRLATVTREWLTGAELPGGELVMRADNDRRPARLFKIGALWRLAHREVAAFVDDDEEVVRAARLAGFPAVLADWVPRGDTLRRAQDRLGRT